MTEQEIIELGFEQRYISKEESGDKNDYWYYTYDIGDICLITSSNDESGKKMWIVSLFDYSEVVFKDAEPVRDLIVILEKHCKPCTQ
jgi:hypothetical protein